MTMRGIAAQLINRNMIHSLVTPYNHDPHLRRSTCETGTAVQYFPRTPRLSSLTPERNKADPPNCRLPWRSFVAAVLAITKQCPENLRRFVGASQFRLVQDFDPSAPNGDRLTK